MFFFICKLKNAFLHLVLLTLYFCVFIIRLGGFIMGLSVLDIEKGADKLRESFFNKKNTLSDLEEKILSDEKVQLYIFLHEKLSRLKSEEKDAINDYYTNVRKKCDHPLYLCVTDGNDFGYSYKCICLNCGQVKHFKQYELDEMFTDHRVIVQKVDYQDKQGKNAHYYTTLASFNEAFEYYKWCFSHMQKINDNLNIDNSIEDAVAEATFNHFVYPDKEKKKGRQLKKNR